MKQNIITKFLIIFLAIASLFATVNANQEMELLRYQFEENGGSIILDSTGNNFNSVRTGGRWQTNEKWGNHNFDFDGTNDYLTTQATSPIPPQVSISFWARPDATSSFDTIWFMETVDGDLDFHQALDLTNDNIRFSYSTNPDSDLFVTDIVTYTGEMTNPTYDHYVTNIDTSTGYTEFYINNVLVHNETYTDMAVSLEQNFLRIGTAPNLAQDFNGDLDEFRIFNTMLNTSQINELFTNNTVTLDFQAPEPETNESQTINLINSYAPINTTESTEVTFNLNLNQKANCDFYLDNNLAYIFEDIVAVEFKENLEVGEHDYFYYCYIDINETQFYELTPINSFTVDVPENVISFKVNGKDFDVNEHELYITTPCPKEGFSAIGFKPGYQSKYNPQGIYFKELVNGVATFNLTAENHELCLFNGRVIINEEGYTTNYNVQEFKGILELGNFSVPSDRYEIYNLNVEAFEIYEFTRPEAYNESYGSLAGAFLMLVLGGLIMIAGVRTQSKVAVLIGGTLLLGAFGLSIGGVLTLLNL